MVFMVQMMFCIYYYCATRFWLWCTFHCVKFDKSSRLPVCKLIHWIIYNILDSFRTCKFIFPMSFCQTPLVLFDSLYNKLHLQGGTNGGISGLIRPAVSKPTWLSALVQCHPLPLPFPLYGLRNCKSIQEMKIHSNPVSQHFF